MLNAAQKTDSQLIIEIRQIEASPTSHLTWKVRAEREQYLDSLYTEARKRDLI